MGGAERFAVRLAESADVVMVCPADSELARRVSNVRAFSFPKPLPRNAPRMPGTVLKLRRLLGEVPDGAVVVANTARTQAYAAAATAAMRRPPALVHVLHERLTSERRIAPAVLARSGGLVAVGERVAAAYRSRLKNADPVRVNIFLTAAELSAAPGEPPRDGSPVLGVLGRLIPEKGISELVEELATISGAWDRLLVAAAAQDRDYELEVRDRIARNGMEDRVELLGHVDDLDAFFERIDVHVVPSTGPEGQVFGVLEGLVRGRPSVVRRSVLSPEYDGLPVAGYASADDLADAIMTVRSAAIDRQELARRFGPDQALRGILRAARAPG